MEGLKGWTMGRAGVSVRCACAAAAVSLFVPVAAHAQGSGLSQNSGGGLSGSSSKGMGSSSGTGLSGGGGLGSAGGMSSGGASGGMGLKGSSGSSASSGGALGSSKNGGPQVGSIPHMSTPATSMPGTHKLKKTPKITSQSTSSASLPSQWDYSYGADQLGRSGSIYDSNYKSTTDNYQYGATEEK